MSRWIGWSLAALVALAAGCGDDTVNVVPEQCGSQCDPLAAPGHQGCDAGKKCSAVILPASHESMCPDNIVMGCVPAGDKAIGARCTWGPPGTTTGFDDCVAGALCASDTTCRDVCGFGDGPDDACTGGLTCFPQAGRFEPEMGGDPKYGICAPPL
ncbi:MAG TPA: hypothetical protein VHE35_16970 [Kofleriaceae bacterium]|nr:hypothetical protein [Kofleriaceae bacterium]